MSATSELPRRLRQRRAASAAASANQAILEWLTTLVDKHDTYTGGHSRRVADYASAIARVMGLAPAHIGMVKEAGLLHDIGKVSIPMRVLQKKEPLSDNEFALIKMHPVFGANIVSRVEGLGHLVAPVLHHHERWDGAGYPRGVAGVDIPLEARIIFVADSFDAMTSTRPYSAPMAIDEAMGELRRCSGQQFDPGVVAALHDAFLKGLIEEIHRSQPPPRPRLV